MAHEVVVVGGGIGGLTAAALLAARGVGVCLLEKEPRVGGCVSSVESFGYSFETGAGLYAAWQEGDIHRRVFGELDAAPPDARRREHAYLVRLPDGAQVRVGGESGEFEYELKNAFPECREVAARFYSEARGVADALRRAARLSPALATTSRINRLKLMASDPLGARKILAAMNQNAARHLAGASERFRRFIDVQLQIFAQTTSHDCPYLYAAVALTEPLRGMYTIAGGGQALADALADSIRRSGGTVRLNATALRLNYDASGGAAGIDLLSGERVEATRAVISNLTVWDTYGRLVGRDRTPAHVGAKLKELRGWGAYQIFAGVDEETANGLPSEQVLALADPQSGEAYDPERAQFMLGVAPSWDARAPEGRRAATISTFTDAERWFRYHADETEHEEEDRRALERCWGMLHSMMPELGGGIEVVETATPRTFYERTRRRFGMVGGVGHRLSTSGPNSLTHQTTVANLFMVGDTVFPGNGVAAVTQSALIVADEIAPPGR